MNQETQLVQILQRHARSTGHGVKRIIGHMELDGHLFGESFGEAMKEGAASVVVDAVAYDVGI